MSNDENAMCPVCFRPATVRSADDVWLHVECRACGDYEIDADSASLLVSSTAPPPVGNRLSNAMRQPLHRDTNSKLSSEHANRILMRRMTRETHYGRPTIRLIRWLTQNDSFASLAIEGWAAVAFTTDDLSAAACIAMLVRHRLIVTYPQEGDLITLSVTDAGKYFLKRYDARLRRIEKQQGSRPARASQNVFGYSYLSDLHIKDFKCFGQAQHINFADDTGKISKWSFLLGENGVGKTSILRLIATLFPAWREGWDNPAISIGQKHGAEDLIAQSAQNRAGSHAELVLHNAPLGEGLHNPAVSGFSKSPESLDEYGLALDLFADVYAMSWGKVFTYNAAYDLLPLNPLIFAYGASRLFAESSLSSSRENSDPTASLFDLHLPLQNPEEHLLQADYAARFRNERAKGSIRLYNRLRDALMNVLPGVTDVTVMPPDEYSDRPWVGFSTSYGTVKYTDLSVGYQSVIAWIVDLAVQLVAKNPSAPNPLATPCVVLIDEIDLHLHPVWQRSITTHLDMIFPGAQFIATTHSPLVIQGAIDANLILLQESDGEVRVTNEVDAIRNWRVDQILTSELFGLESARPDDISELHRKRNSILSQYIISDTDKAELDSLTARLGSVERDIQTPPLEDRAKALINRLRQR